MMVDEERRIYAAFAQLRGGPSMASRAVCFWRQVADPSADPSDIDEWRKLVGDSHDSPDAMARGARMVGASTIRSIRVWIDKLDSFGSPIGNDEAPAYTRDELVAVNRCRALARGRRVDCAHDELAAVKRERQNLKGEQGVTGAITPAQIDSPRIDASYHDQQMREINLILLSNEWEWNKKGHSVFLLPQVRFHKPDDDLFPRWTKEEKRPYHAIRDAYTHAGWNVALDFVNGIDRMGCDPGLNFAKMTFWLPESENGGAQ